jgi:hypothetical protein
MDSKKYIVMDVHKESISIAVRNAAGKIVMECVIETKASMILQFIDGLRGSTKSEYPKASRHDLGWRAQRTTSLLPVAGDVFSLDSPLYRTHLPHICSSSTALLRLCDLPGLSARPGGKRLSETPEYIQDLRETTAAPHDSGSRSRTCWENNQRWPSRSVAPYCFSP